MFGTNNNYPLTIFNLKPICLWRISKRFIIFWGWSLGQFPERMVYTYQNTDLTTTWKVCHVDFSILYSLWNRQIPTSRATEVESLHNGASWWYEDRTFTKFCASSTVSANTPPSTHHSHLVETLHDAHKNMWNIIHPWNKCACKQYLNFQPLQEWDVMKS